MTDTTIREEVRQRYAVAAKASTCADPGCCDPTVTVEDFGAAHYRAEELEAIPGAAAALSLGCGNPTAVAELKAGETVLDLGSGGGIDVLLSAQRVGPGGFVYGLDMTEEMVGLAEENARQANVTNVEFLRGYIEEIPLSEHAVDVVISNCVINLSADKGAVFSEMARVLRPGGRLGISDVVADDDLSEDDRAERGSWAGCVAGALTFSEYERGLRGVGFTQVEITATHAVADGMHSAIIKAVKPVA